ncbi:glycoside hydrolase family 16 protein [Microbacterium sp.]|uniref:glycoside hydrolase family 16 protein n=1 Tax=Microbacterium sp. TaxID=51671 RepID=UPI002C2B2494|nr:glycoside hydrolase family 16 protein [Microbacterium sp.]HWL79086.1 glycoside hydrolase family 16 protein [Microbacterium sp.]
MGVFERSAAYFGEMGSAAVKRRSTRRAHPVVLLLLACGLVGCVAHGAATGEPTIVETGAVPAPSPTPSEAKVRSGLAWADEFARPLGDDRWRFAQGAHGWGNNELQAYTDRPENAMIANGILTITARREPAEDSQGNRAEYTSARLYSNDAFRYGRFEARIKAPIGNGFWSAFWLYGVESPTQSWPDVGEIDIMELLDKTLDLNSAVWGARTDGEPWSRSIGASTTGEPWGGDWHVYGVEWRPDAVVFLLDGEERGRIERSELAEDEVWSLDHPANIVINLAIGGDWGSAVDETTPFPAHLQVDWVRVHDAEVYPGLNDSGW